MIELLREIPNAEVLLSLEPEELAAKMIFILRRYKRPSIAEAGVSGFVPNALHGKKVYSSVSQTHEDPGIDAKNYPTESIEEIRLALNEAFSWLIAQSLVIRDIDSNGYYTLSRRSRRFTTEVQFANYATAKLLQKDILHHSVSEAAWQSFMRGAYATAVFEAMREVEIAVRSAAGFAETEHGVPMIRRAFGKTGPLTNQSAHEAEQEALSSLFAGAIGSYKNPHSHRNVSIDSPREAAEIVMLASHLLRVVDARMQAKADGA